MNDLHRPFLSEILAHPTEDGPRLVFTDWLEERGERRTPPTSHCPPLASPGLAPRPSGWGWGCIKWPHRTFRRGNLNPNGPLGRMEG